MKKRDLFVLILLLVLDAILFFVTQKSQRLLWAVALAVTLWLTLESFLRLSRGRVKRSRMRPALVRILMVLAGIVEMTALLYGLFYFVQDFALFHPNKDLDSWEYLAAQPDFEAVEFSSNNRTWHGIFRNNASNEPSPLILLFCGNGQNAAQAMRQMDAFGIWPYFWDYQCLLVDYAGYGLNDGLPSAADMCAEALAAFDFAAALPEVSRVIVGGYSIGAGPAVYLAAHRETDGLFLLAPFANGYDLYNNVLPIFHGPLRLFVKHRFPSDQYAEVIAAPVLVVASRDDEMVPFTSSERLAGCFGGETTFVTLSGVGHNGIFFNRVTIDNIKIYLYKLYNW